MVQIHCCEKYRLMVKATVFDIVAVSSSLTIFVNFRMKTNTYKKVITIKNNYLSNNKIVKLNRLKKDRFLLKLLIKNGFMSSFVCQKNNNVIHLNFDRFLNCGINTLDFIPKN
tara:strand:- start:4111 stop:4449 length:339 start_codon:yes stop_codon:yes gene_type:complete